MLGLYNNNVVAKSLINCWFFNNPRNDVRETPRKYPTNIKNACFIDRIK